MGKILSFVLLYACVALAKPSFDPKAIHIQIGGEPSTLDPTMAIDQYSIGILRNMYEGLFKLDPDGKLQNGLIDSYKVSKDRLTYTFKLKKAEWSDGRPVEAEDFVFSLRRLIDPSTGSQNAEFFFYIKNAREVFEKKMSADQLGVQGKGRDLVITLSEPDPSLPMELSLPAAAPLRKDLFDSSGGKWKPEFPVTGDYVIGNYKVDSMIELMPNPKKGGAHQKVVYHILQEDMTALNLFESGHLDIVSTLPFNELERVKQTGVVKSVPSTTVFFLSFNCEKEPFKDIEARKTIARAIDKGSREAFVTLLRGTYASVESFIPSNLEGYFESPKPPLARLEVPASLKDRRVTIAFGSSAFTKLVTERLQNDLKTKLGIQLNVEPMELKMLLGRLRSDPPDMYLLGMSAIYNDPMNHLKAFSAAAAPNFSRYNNPEFEKLLEKFRTHEAGAKRTKLAKQMNELLVLKDFALVPLVHRTQVMAVTKRLSGFQLSPYQVITLKNLRKQN